MRRADLWVAVGALAVAGGGLALGLGLTDGGPNSARPGVLGISLGARCSGHVQTRRVTIREANGEIVRRMNVRAGGPEIRVTLPAGHYSVLGESVDIRSAKSEEIVLFPVCVGR